MDYWDFTLSILPPSKGYILQYTPWGVYGINANDIMRESWAYWLFKWYTVRIRTRLGIYGKTHPFAFRSSLGLRPRTLLQAKGYIWPYITPLVLIRIQYSTVQSGYCCAVQLSAFKFSVMTMILVSVLLSAQVKTLSAYRMRWFFLQIGFMKQYIFYCKKVWWFV